MSGRFEQVLDECIERIRGGELIEQVLRSYPDEADELRPLLTIARDLEATPEPMPSVTGMMRMLVKASGPQDQNAKRRITFFSRAFLVRAAAVLLVVFLAGWGTVAASANTVPGDLLYPVKRFTERARFFLTINQEGKAELRIVFSSERLKEAVKRYQESGQLDQGLLNEMLQEARLAADSADSFSGPSRELVAGQAAYLSDYQQRMLSSLKPSSSPQGQQVLEQYSDLCGRRAQWMRGMCGWDVPPGSTQSGNQAPQQSGQTGGQSWRDMCPW